MTSEKTEFCFSITIDTQPVNVRYRPDYFTAADYAHFEFTSPEPGHRMPLSETGYRSHFAPMGASQP